MDQESPVGTLLAFVGKIDEEHWIICDGNEYDNSDNRFAHLLDVGFGKQNGDKYVSPDFNNMVFINNPHKNDNSKLIADNFVKQNRYLGHFHYIDDDNSAEMVQKKYFKKETNIHTNIPHLLDYIRKNEDTREKYNDIMKWIIRYK